MKQLAVFFNNTKAGVLTELQPGRGYLYRYDDEYIKSGNPPISVNLPKNSGVYKSETLFPFFANILPEGANRKVICRAKRIDEADLFGLLEAMADSDFVGAVEVRKTTND